MSALAHVYLALAIYFIAMLGIGYYAYLRTRDHEDYMLAGRNLPPWVAALSAGASDMSGWLMMGLPGAIYASGLFEAWIAIGLFLGAYLNWRLVAPRLRAYTAVSRNSITIPSFFENRLRDSSRVLRIVSGVVILVFFTLYISAGMVAGGIFFESSFQSSYLTGMLLVAGVTLAYTLFGGFLGASLTDVVQGTMMMLALLVVPFIAIAGLGGPGETFDLVRSVEPGHLSLLSGKALSGSTLILIISAMAWGLGYFGQPHIIVRFMALQNPQSATAARRIGMSWMALTLGGAVLCGIVGVAWFRGRGEALADPETVVLLMSQALLHPLVAGFVLAAVLAAIMSTVSSQLIVCSSALVEDLYLVFGRADRSPQQLVFLGRMCVLAVAIIATLLALTPGGTILELVAFAWAGFGAAFGPLILLCLFWNRLTTWGALAGMVAGSATVFIWKSLGTDIYELLPAFCVSLGVSVVVSLLSWRHNDEIEQEFAEARAMVAGPGRLTASGSPA